MRLQVGMVHAGNGASVSVPLGQGRGGSPTQSSGQECSVACCGVEAVAVFVDEDRRTAADPIDSVTLKRIAE